MECFQYTQTIHPVLLYTVNLGIVRFHRSGHIYVGTNSMVSAPTLILL